MLRFLVRSYFCVSTVVDIHDLLRQGGVVFEGGGGLSIYHYL